MPEQYEMVDGKHKILLFRKYGNNSEAAKLVFQTEHTFEYNRDIDRIETKDGTVIKVGELETNVDINAVQAKDDPVGDMLRQSVIEGEKLELWEVTVDPKKEEDGKYPAIYTQGYLESWSDPAGIDEPEITGTFNVEMQPQFGMATLTEAQQEAVQYEFRDTTAEEAGE
ncbi:phage major tail protein, TP901-1 family [Alkalicoccus luteus]|uniref:Phage major tail protein, TP901-1 family n=1 Tax=Alkalicoccus luteus TaxID=1237094 RepID=A0A969PU28_9BACI|nr:phage major tail protein, TP901-1 family [Alkalicoccus luteus]NJP37923.1 phage major tail protein, TP901-1 family [Alkalicoccus luteus]